MVTVVTGDSKEEVMIFRDTQGARHYYNIYIHPTILIIIIIIIIMLPNTILILILIIIVSNQSSSLAGLNVTICLHPRPPTASSTTANHSRFFHHQGQSMILRSLKSKTLSFFAFGSFWGCGHFQRPGCS